MPALVVQQDGVPRADEGGGDEMPEMGRCEEGVDEDEPFARRARMHERSSVEGKSRGGVGDRDGVLQIYKSFISCSR